MSKRALKRQLKSQEGILVDVCALIIGLEKGNDLIVPINKDNFRELVAEFETEEVA